MKKGIALCFTTGLFILAFLIFAAPLPAAEKVQKLNFSDFYAPANPFAKLVDEWCREVEKATEGRVIITPYHSNILTPMNQTYSSVVKGVADVGQSLPSYSMGRFPLTEVLTLPLGSMSGKQASGMANAYFKKFHPKEFDDVKVLFLHASGPGIFHTRKVVSSFNEIKGLRFKVNAEIADIARAVGAVPVVYAASETYDALVKGVLDGALTTWDALKTFRYGEVLKTTLENYGVAKATSFFWVMNKDKWNAISKRDQAAIEKITEEIFEKQAKAWEAADEDGKKFGKEKGMVFVRSSKAEEAATAEKMKPILGEYLKMTKEKGLPGADALKFCQDFIKQHP